MYNNNSISIDANNDLLKIYKNIMDAQANATTMATATTQIHNPFTFKNTILCNLIQNIRS